jgi:glycosyltransferase involved in cell wall biosynthesis
MTIRLGFPLLGRGGWAGGYVYLENTLKLICSRLADEIEPYVFLSPAEGERHRAALEPLVGGRIVVDSAFAASGRGRSLAMALLTGRDPALKRLIDTHGVDVVFENASFFGWRFGTPVIAWMPDFQHRYMPEMFTRLAWWRRDIGFRVQIAAGRTVMLSSDSARNDLERFYPAARGRGHVVRFAIPIDVSKYLGRAEEMRAVYDLPERWFFLPNQFWKHKNHALVIDALARLKSAGALDALPPIILSGRGEDPRYPDYYPSLLAKVGVAGVGSHFRHLGLIPHDHVLALAGCCDWVINPSHFEGWSTPIEEAKALGAPLILSSIPIHREQAPHARFFDPLSVEEFAMTLADCAQNPPPPRAPLVELEENQNARLNAHAAALLATTRAAMGRGNNPA